jgi:hypothetical protein
VFLIPNDGILEVYKNREKEGQRYTRTGRRRDKDLKINTKR